jgi:hypothetical protein
MAKLTLQLKVLSDVAVATAGVPVPLSGTSLLVRQAVIQYDGGNTGDIFVGESDVTQTKCLVLNSTSPSLALEAEDTVADEDNVFFDLADVYIDAANNGDKVKVAYVELASKEY